MQSPKKTQQNDDSDSENDPDYVPPANDLDSEDDLPAAKRLKSDVQDAVIDEATEAEKKRTRDALWSSFQASLASSSTSSPAATSQKRMVKIVKRHMFAGEEVTEIKEVPEDSDDARAWPRWEDTAVTNAEKTASTATSLDTASVPEGFGDKATPKPTPTPPPATPAKRPGPRKSKTKLGPIPSSASKAKKLTTLDKSAMDWRAHVTTTQDPELKDELEANRRGGGYLEKVEFLQRVDERREEAFEANKGGKRRRG